MREGREWEAVSGKKVGGSERKEWSGSQREDEAMKE